MFVALDEMENSIVDDLSMELSYDEEASGGLLRAKVRNAIREVERARKYPESYTVEEVERDMENYYSNVRGLALYDYNQVGAEGEQSHSENGISRSYVNRQSLFNGIIPMAQIAGRSINSMRTLRRNRQKMYYSLFMGNVDEYVTDDSGNTVFIPYDGEFVPQTTGRQIPSYSEPVKFYANIHSSGGEAEATSFGVSVGSYDCVMYLPKNKLPITETSLIWYETIPVIDKDGKADPDTADYTVVRVPQSLDETIYLLKKVVKSYEQDADGQTVY